MDRIKQDTNDKTRKKFYAELKKGNTTLKTGNPNEKTTPKTKIQLLLQNSEKETSSIVSHNTRNACNKCVKKPLWKSFHAKTDEAKNRENESESIMTSNLNRPS